MPAAPFAPKPLGQMIGQLAQFMEDALGHNVSLQICFKCFPTKSKGSLRMFAGVASVCTCVCVC